MDALSGPAGRREAAIGAESQAMALSSKPGTLPEGPPRRTGSLPKEWGPEGLQAPEIVPLLSEPEGARVEVALWRVNGGRRAGEAVPETNSGKSTLQ